MFTAQEIIELWNRTEGDWSGFRSMWKSAGTYVRPQSNNLMVPPSSAIAAQGAEKTTRLTDTSAGDANRNLAAGLYAYLFPINEQPFSLVAVPEELNEQGDVASAMSKMTKITQTQLASSNFPLRFFTFLEYFGCYGGACLYSEPNRKATGPALNFKNIPIGNVLALEDNTGQTDTLLYRFAYTPRQAAQEWVKPGMTPAITEAILGKKLADMVNDSAQMHKPQDFIHVVYPRGTWNPLKQDDTGKPWVSQYVHVDGKHLVHKGGYYEMPYSLSWFWKSDEEQAGRGPGTEGLPEFRMLNRMNRTFIKAAEKQCDPPMFVPDDGALSPYRTDPAGIIVYRPGLSKNDFWTLDTHTDVRLNQEMIDRQREIVSQKFFNHLFQPLSDYRNMTATEAIERTEQNLRMLIPPVARLQRELLNSQIIRAVKILARAGYFPFLDELGMDITFKIEYQGKLALAVKELEGHALSQSLNIMAAYLQVDESPLDNLEADKSFRDILLSRGVPADWLKSADDVMAIREQRQQAAQAEQMMQQAESMARTAKDAGKPTDDSSPLAQLAKGAQA